MSPPYKEIPASWGDFLTQEAGQQYVYEGCIGIGGEGVVIKAWDEESNSWVAIKFALPGIYDSERQYEKKKKKSGLKSIWLELRNGIMAPTKTEENDTEHTFRYKRGIRIQQAARKHVIENGLQAYGYVPAVLRVNTGAKLFFVMEYIPGKKLLSWCKHKSKNERLQMFLKMLIFMEKALHHRGIAHTDCSPDSWLIVGDIPVLVDFGIAISKFETRVTRVSTDLGKPGFRPLDQKVRSKSRGYASDIAIMARTMWCMHEGHVPDFSGCTAEHEALRQFKESVFSFSLREIYKKASAAVRENRYKTIEEFKGDLEEVISERSPLSGLSDESIAEVEKLKAKIELIAKTFREL